MWSILKIASNSQAFSGLEFLLFGLWSAKQVHYNLFAGSVLAVGNEEQVKQLDEIQQKAEGCTVGP